jgi:hypothetical protein
MIQEQDSKNSQISPIPKVNGAKFIVGFIIVAAITAVLVCYAIYRGYESRPLIKIEDEK